MIDETHWHTKYFWDFELKIPPPVYEPAEDTALIAEAMVDEKRVFEKLADNVLDMGCGSGALTILAAKYAKRVVAVDVNPWAAIATKINAKRLGYGDKVEVICGDLLAAFAEQELFTAAIFNPPYLPGEEDDGIVDSLTRMWWHGGVSGYDVVVRFARQVWPLLKPGGVVVFVVSSISNVAHIVSEMVSIGYVVDEIRREKLFFEELIVFLGEKPNRAC